MYHQSVFHKCNYIFTFDKTNYLEFKAMGVDYWDYFPYCVAKMSGGDNNEID